MKSCHATAYGNGLLAAAVLVTATLVLIAATRSDAPSADSGTSLVQSGTTSSAQQKTTGQYFFRTYCASCHGTSGMGDGPLASSMRRRPANLTEIAKRNGGVFPSDLVFRVIDGRQPVRGHGGSDMPVWGDAFRRSLEGTDEASVRQKIQDLVAYLESIQAKLAF